MKNIKKHLLIPLSAMAILPLSTIISCETKNFERYTNTDIGGLNKTFNPNNQQGLNQKVIDRKNEIQKSDDIKSKELLNSKTILISAGGKVNDRSFNQSVWEALSKFSKEIDNHQNAYYEASAVSQASQNESYDYAMAKKFKIWILTGFQHEIFLKNWLLIGNNFERFNALGVTIVSIDWYPKTFKLPRILGINFRTQESSFTVGYSAAKFLSYKYPGINNKSKRVLSTFGGGDFSGVTNFNYGFIQGLLTWNSEQKTDDTKIQFSGPIILDTSFSITADSRQKVNYIMDGGKNKQAPKIIMPVAGSLTSATIDRSKEKNIGQMIIGVDTDQSLAFPNDAGSILTSSEKRISIATYMALNVLYGIDIDGSIIGKNFISQELSDEIINGFDFAKDIQGGYSKGFVGTSKSTLANPNDRELFNKILDETKEAFFGKNGILADPPIDNLGTQYGENPFLINDGNVKINNTNANDKNFFDEAILKINSWL